MPTTTPAAADAELGWAGYAYYDAVARSHDNRAILGSELGQIQSQILRLIRQAGPLKIYNGTGATLQLYHAVGVAGWNTANGCFAAAVAHPGNYETDPIPAVGFPVASIANGATGYIEACPAALTAKDTTFAASALPLYLCPNGSGHTELGTGNLSTSNLGGLIIQKLGALKSIDASAEVHLQVFAPIPAEDQQWITKNTDYTIVRARGELYQTTASRTAGSALTLPAVRSGAVVRVASTGAAGARIVTPTGVYIHYGDDVDNYRRIETTGNGAITLWCNGTNWYVREVVGNWSTYTTTS